MAKRQLTLDQLKEKVRRQYPGAYVTYDRYKNVCIIYDDVYGNEINILHEFLLPPTKDIRTAWENALLVCKTNQNFNRTHPLRVDGYELTEKLERIENRKFRGKINKETNR